MPYTTTNAAANYPFISPQISLYFDGEKVRCLHKLSHCLYKLHADGKELIPVANVSHFSEEPGDPRVDSGR